MARKKLIAVAIGLLLPVAAEALTLGYIKVGSLLDQPLKAAIEVTADKPSEIESLRVNLAPASQFSKKGIPRLSVLDNLRFQVVRKNDRTATIVVTSSVPIREPILDMLVDANWGDGKVTREYTLLLDPPLTADRKPPAIDIPKSAVVVAPAPAPAAKKPASATAAPKWAGEPEKKAKPAKKQPAAAKKPTPAKKPAPARKPAVRPDTLKVRSGDTLWELAAKVTPSGATVYQSMNALYQDNKRAFGGNINNLRKGSVLDVPAPEDILALDPGASQRLLAEHTRAWRTGTPVSTAIAKAAAPAPKVAEEPPEKPKAVDIPPPPVEEEESVPATLRLASAGEGETPVSDSARKDSSESAAPTGADSGSSQSEELLIAREEAASAQQEVANLRERLVDLEARLKDARRLLELQDEQLARLQALYAQQGSEDKASAPAPEPVAAPEPAPVEEPPAQITLAEPEEEPQIALADPSDEVVKLSPKDGEVPFESDPEIPLFTDAVDPAAEAMVEEAPAEAPAPVMVEEPVSEPAPPPAPRLAMSDTPRADAEAKIETIAAQESDSQGSSDAEVSPFLPDELAGLPVLPTLGLLAVAGLFGLLFVGRRRDDDEALVATPMADGGAAATPLHVERVDLEAELSLLDEKIAAHDWAEAGSRAEALIASNPDDPGVNLRMLEVLYGSGDKDRFMGQAHKLASTGFAANHPVFWGQVESMGQKLVPGATLFSPQVGGHDDFAAPVQREERDLHGMLDTLESQLDQGDEVFREEATAALDDTANDLDRARMLGGEEGLDFDPREAIVPDLSAEQPLVDVQDMVEFNAEPPADEPMTAPVKTPIQDDTLDFDLGDLGMGAAAGATFAAAGQSIEPEKAVPPEPEETFTAPEPLVPEPDVPSEPATVEPVTPAEPVVREEPKIPVDPMVPTAKAKPTAPASTSGLPPVTEEDVETKLDLARAFLDLGDAEGARSILEEVLAEGNERQQLEAESLLRSTA